MNTSGQMASIEMVPGKQGPFYKDVKKEIGLHKVVITENGTEGGLPIVDFVMEDANGDKYLLVLTGRIVNAIAAAVQGANMRNYGVREP